ncbi:flagellar basal body-associated protein FliL [Planococcus sp. CPCC 101016]|uniref:flagellar basal body-associated FliL family protein n=1 Tax=Planococcus sp. CPCC 101016 TaxID=2599617 RepID=UPI0011B4092C|nr:flagellar basal body-associated FliL family protein [Planococcus sp. CPCC 101016]TWT04479.1 flagellar basal body-associated protein FliL [Planococcus sp. CPCC 101016]
MGKFKNIIIIIILASVIGVGAAFLFSQKTASSEDKPLTAEELVELSIDTDIITTNLASASNFAVVQFNIALDNKKTKEETEKRTSEVRAAIISTVAGFTKEELVSKDGIATLEEQLTAKLNDMLDKGHVERVLVTEFKVQ